MHRWPLEPYAPGEEVTYFLPGVWGQSPQSFPSYNPYNVAFRSVSEVTYFCTFHFIKTILIFANSLFSCFNFWFYKTIFIYFS